ncbi:patronin isoform X5 [Neocloeon triangulifer]|uniref:patronin isoform X5 n=1 Tax=Neocloeon triangulifer TaxID=2078957 RepID=UPI00286EEC78|nr:patronin isoform X5 [Neocloeon triangulifer]
MWSTITNLFATRQPESQQPELGPSAEEQEELSTAMERPLQRRLSAANLLSSNGQQEESYDPRQAKQRASVKWLLSKAFNGRVPDNLREPFYRDHEGQFHLKPHITHTLANAELYCLALSNIYADPNFHNLNHSGIVNALIRKGVTPEPPGQDCPLTETTLFQTNPLRLSAHLAIIESMMALYAKEVATPDAVSAAIIRLSHLHQEEAVELPNPTTPQQSLLAWLNCSSKVMNTRLKLDGANNYQLIPEVHNIQDLSDGVALAALVALYCPSELPWENVLVPNSQQGTASVGQSVQNLSLVQQFCQEALPSDLMHMAPEDVTYLRSGDGFDDDDEFLDAMDAYEARASYSPPAAGGSSTALAMLSCAHSCRRRPPSEHHSSMNMNLLAFLADMFNVMEIHPAKCVCFPGSGSLSLKDPRNNQGVGHRRSLYGSQVISPIPDLRSNLSLPHPTVTKSASSLSNPSSGSTPVVQMTSSSLRRTMSLHHTPAPDQNLGDESREMFVVHKSRAVPTLLRSRDESDERHLPAAGKPSNWEQVSRRSSTPQHTPQPNSTERPVEKSLAGRRSRRNSINAEESQLTVENFGGSQDNLQFIGRNPDKDVAVHVGRRLDMTIEKPAPIKNLHNMTSLEMNSSFSVQHASNSTPITPTINNGTRTYNGDSDSENVRPTNFAETSRQNTQNSQQAFDTPTKIRSAEKKTATFADLPNTTTWRQQQQQQHQQLPFNEAIPTQEEGQVMATQLHNIRLKLEEKRRHIENDKMKTEMALSKQRQKVGKAAFLQAVTKTQRLLGFSEINDDVIAVESRWLSQEGIPQHKVPPEDPRTPDLEHMDIESYHNSLVQMNSSLKDLQADIQRLASRQQHIHHVLEQRPQSMSPQPPQQQQQQQQQQQMQQQQQPPHQSEFYLHSGHPQPQYIPPQQPQQPNYNTYNPYNPHNQYQQPQYQPTPPPRRTWASPNPMPIPMQQQQQPQGPPPGPAGDGYIPHNAWVDPGRQNIPKYPQPQHYSAPQQHHPQNTPPGGGGFMLHPASSNSSSNQMSYSLHNGSNTASPQHRNTLNRLNQMMGQQQAPHVTTVPIPGPPVDDPMAPQPIAFIGTPENRLTFNKESGDVMEDVNVNIQRLNITSGSRTYRLPSPTRPISKGRPAYQTAKPDEEEEEGEDVAPPQTLKDGVDADKGFYVSFDEPPKRPKPPLRTKKVAKKQQELMQQQMQNDYEMAAGSSGSSSLASRLSPQPGIGRTMPRPSPTPPSTPSVQQYSIEATDEEISVQMTPVAVAGEGISGLGLVIGDIAAPDPGALDAMEKKKEKILLASLRRRQQQEENKARKELAASLAKEREQTREERQAMKREEDRFRRAQILQQYKLKKTIEEAEREGKVIDKAELQRLQAMCSTPSSPSSATSNASSGGPRMRNKTPGTTPRPRPKTIHIERGQDGSNGDEPDNRQFGFRRQGSATNLADSASYGGHNTMRRAAGYRGSQDNLTTTRRNSMYNRESSDDGRGTSRGTSPSRIGRRGSYRTSRGSSTDQDSLAYPRFGDTDSGLGRATPPRRAPSPGMGVPRHLPSPSGPGSLPPGLMSKRRPFDDASSDISSASSMMEYTGPRLYRQPATKSNRGIMLNAVEYCVFPGVVNREAKRRVLEEIARSESKHFLILFRDAGCQFRALYSYCPDRDEVLKLYGTGPRQVTENMLDKFFKYNSGGKCFSVVHTKHLTVTIDAFTIHNSLWQGKKVSLPSKRDMVLVI